MTPHVFDYSNRYRDNRFLLYRENLRRFVAGDRMLNVVDLQRVLKQAARATCRWRASAAPRRGEDRIGGPGRAGKGGPDVARATYPALASPTDTAHP
jgi:hypothetical protein